MKKSILAAAAAFAFASGAMVGQASAADLYVAPPPAPAPFVPTWQGFYIGGHVGYGEGTSDYRQDPAFDFDLDGDADLFGTFRSSVNPEGFLGGVQGGYNWQVNSLVFGIEGDISFTDWDAGATVFDTNSPREDLGGPYDAFGDRIHGTSSTDIDFLASVRGRLGYAMSSVMVYGTGGVAWAEGDATARVIAIDNDVVVVDESGKSDLSDVGFVAGGGLAWMVVPQTVSVGVEGLYYWFKDSATLIDETDLAAYGGDMDIRATAELHDAWVVRARADFHF